MSRRLVAKSFLDVIRRSGLIEEGQLEFLLSEMRGEGINLKQSRMIAEMLVAKGALTRWQADKLLLGKYKGFILAEYRLLELLGKGGMNFVYLANMS